MYNFAIEDLSIDSVDLLKLINKVDAWNFGKVILYIRPHVLLIIDNSTSFKSDNLIGGELFGIEVRSLEELQSCPRNYGVYYNVNVAVG